MDYAGCVIAEILSNTCLKFSQLSLLIFIVPDITDLANSSFGKAILLPKLSNTFESIIFFAPILFLVLLSFPNEIEESFINRAVFMSNSSPTNNLLSETLS